MAMSISSEEIGDVRSPLGIGRRTFFLGMFTLLAAPGQALANGAQRKFVLEERFLPQVVRTPYDYLAGTIVVVPRERFLYLVDGAGFARRYGIGVGKAGLAFSGSAIIGRKAKWPSWRPTDNMIRRDPKKYMPLCWRRARGAEQPIGVTGSLPLS
ncbi:L,D-transpeptidase [Aquibium oceanicum]|uniref:L,D-transpeptidase n=1 Tax=Aquibium oceanicum TaxID=1670800 RepID=UPI003AAD8C4E